METRFQTVCLTVQWLDLKTALQGYLDVTAVP
jgi:hypothetical protein